MSRDDKKPPGPAGSSSSPALPSVSELSLQELLGEITRGISGSTRGNLAVQKIVADALEAISKQIGGAQTNVASQIGQQDVRRQQQLADIQRELGESNDHNAALVVALKELYGVIVARTKEERDLLDGAVKEFKDSSQKFLTQRGEVVEDSISASGIRVRWVTIIHYARTGVPVAVKIGGLVAAIGASIYKLFEGLEPYTHWFHGWFS